MQKNSHVLRNWLDEWRHTRVPESDVTALDYLLSDDETREDTERDWTHIENFLRMYFPEGIIGQIASEFNVDPAILTHERRKVLHIGGKREIVMPQVRPEVLFDLIKRTGPTQRWEGEYFEANPYNPEWQDFVVVHFAQAHGYDTMDLLVNRAATSMPKSEYQKFESLVYVVNQHNPVNRLIINVDEIDRPIDDENTGTVRVRYLHNGRWSEGRDIGMISYWFFDVPRKNMRTLPGEVVSYLNEQGYNSSPLWGFVRSRLDNAYRAEIEELEKTRDSIDQMKGSVDGLMAVMERVKENITQKIKFLRS